MQRGFAHLVLLLFILLVSVSVLTYLYWYLRPVLDLTSSINAHPKLYSSLPKFVSQKDQSSQSSYKNVNLGFELNIPDNLTANEDSEEAFNKRGNGDFRKNFTGYVQYSPANVLGIIVVLDSANSFNSSPFTLWIFDNPDNLTIEQWYSKYWYYPFVWGDFSPDTKYKVAPVNESTISGQLAKSSMVTDQKNNYKFIYLNVRGQMFMFRLFADSPNTAIGNQIISSFKFLK